MLKLFDPPRLLRIGLLIALLIAPLSMVALGQQPSAPTNGPEEDEPLSTIFYPEFREVKNPDLHMNEDATTIAGNEWVLRLADNDDSDAKFSGSAWHGIKQPISSRFQSTFQFRTSDPVGARADGLAFVIHNDQRELTTLGNAGCSLGYGGITPSVAIEFDTYINNSLYCAENQDPNGDHVGIQLNGDPKHVAPNSLGVKQLPQNLVSGRVYTASIFYEANVLTVTLDNVFVLSTTVNIAEVVGADTAWVGLVAGTATYRQNHDILNWYFTANWDLRCATFDFTNDDYYFSGDPASWLGQPILGEPYEGWGRNGHATIDRGVNFYSGRPLLDGESGLEAELLEFITRNEQPLPIHQIQIHYTHTGTGNLTGAFDLDLAANSAQDLISNSAGAGPDEVYQEGNQSISIRKIDLPASEVARAVHPAGIRVTLSSGVTTDLLRIKKVGLCVKAGPPPAPRPMPLGARQACQQLLLNIKSRRQPYGPTDITPADRAQSEFQFPTDVVLETYPEFLNLRYIDGYPAPMTYADAPSSHAIVPCAFEQNDQLYLVPDSGGSGEPIVRLTAVGDNAALRGYLILLNYAGYFALARQNWCYAGDNAFALHDRDASQPNRTHSSDPLMYGPGYNVPPPAFACDTGGRSGGTAGPCGSFVGSLFRALGYFNVDAFSQDASVYTLRGLYYGVVAYSTNLPISSHAVNNQQPFTHVDYSNQTQYVPVPISSFSGIRVHARDGAGQRPLGDSRFGSPLDISWSVCNPPPDPAHDPDKCQALLRVSGHWNNAIRAEDIETSPLDRAPSPDPSAPVNIWHSLKPGDLSFNVITFDNGTVEYPHVQVVVGWGPPGWEYSPTDARRGINLYSTYDALPADKQARYVPYVADRYLAPGDGSVPRPFNYGLLHTSVEFWVANH
ncbi:hypothetical protein TFLX_03200 [Thermoflexales bacterium]|nr:hypothetical protein TFLX_03200 [Thermoflexales bacterium]